MTLTTLSKTVLILSSLIAFAVGGAVLFIPVAFYASYTVVLPDDINLLNDIRAFGGGLIASGCIAALGVFVPGFRTASLTVAAVIYFGFGLARVLAIVLDGPPASAFLLIKDLCVIALFGDLLILAQFTNRMH